MKDHKEFKLAVSRSTGFLDWVRDIENEAPRVPGYDPNQPERDKESWIYYSGMREGYKQILSTLGVQLDD